MIPPPSFSRNMIMTTVEIFCVLRCAMLCCAVISHSLYRVRQLKRFLFSHKHERTVIDIYCVLRCAVLCYAVLCHARPLCATLLLPTKVSKLCWLSAAMKTCGLPASLCRKLPATQLKSASRLKLHQQAGADVIMTHTARATACDTQDWS